MIKIGVIGCGHWGPNHIRIFSQLRGSEVLMCADPDKDRLSKIKDDFSTVTAVEDYKSILKSADIDAVIIASPTNTHYSVTKEALEAGKHVLCEKPLAMNPDECEELRDLAASKERILMVGHIFLFNAGINWLKECIQSGELGHVYYAYAIRTNLGPFRYDVNAMWDLAPHDISIFNYLFDSAPVSVSARGQKVLGTAQEDLAFINLDYANNIMANIHVSWLDPKKVRQITIVGEKKMATWDDLDNLGSIKLYDKHVEKTSSYYSSYGEFQLLSKDGSITIPKIGFSEPLKKQGEFFLAAIEGKEDVKMADAQRGFDVVKTLCAAQNSLEQKGHCVQV